MCCRWSCQASAALRRRTASEAVVAAVSGPAGVAAQLSAVAVALEAVAVARLSAAVAALEVAVAPRLSAAALEAAAWPLRPAVVAVLGLAPLLADLA